MSTSSFLIGILGILTAVATVPALYVGALLVLKFNLPFVLFAAPACLCLAISGYCVFAAEKRL